VAAESGTARRLCVLANIDGYLNHGQADRADLAARLSDALNRTLGSAGVDPNGTWRQPRPGGEIALLPVGVDAPAVAPLLMRGLLAALQRDQGRSPRVALRLRAACARDTVTQARSGYVGRAVLTVSRLLDSPAPGAALAADRAALLAVIVADDLYRDMIARADPSVPAGGFRWVSVEVPDQGWQGSGWVCAWQPGTLRPPPRSVAGAIRRSMLPVVGGVLSEGASVTGAFFGQDGILTESADDVNPILSDLHHTTDTSDSVDHAGTDDADYADYSASEHAVDEHVADTAVYLAGEDGQVLEEYGTQTEYDVGYDAQDYGAQDYDSSADHPTDLA